MRERSDISVAAGVITHLVVNSCHEGSVAFDIPLPQEGEERGGVLGEQQTQLL